MSYTLKRRFYEGLPDFMKAPAGWIPFRWLAGREYRAVLARGEFFDHATEAQIRAYQEAALGFILEFACANVPAYEGLRATVSRLRPLEALKAFPTLGKDELQENWDRYLPRNVEALPHYECSTGGTSGRQLKLLLDDRSQAVEMAFMHRQWARVGYHPRCRKATFRGVAFRGLQEGIYWQPNPIYNELQFSPFHMHAGTLGRYMDQLLSYRPQFLHGYPSAIATLARYALQSGFGPKTFALRGVLLGSEPVYPDQRELIERAFGARVFSWYGQSERVVLGGECEQTTAYHHFPDYGVLELMNEQGEVVAEPGGRGEIVGTGLLNKSLPLIRYRTGDWARRLERSCACGRSFDRFDEVDAWRQQQFVIGRSGTRMSLAALNVHGAVFDHVLRHQYFQKEKGIMELRVLPAERFDEKDRRALEEAFRAKTGDELVVKVVLVDQLETTARGKVPRLVQTLRVEDSA